MEDGYWATLATRARVTPQEIKDGIDLVWLVEKYGVTLSPIDTGKWIGHCPFHNDSDPSFEVYAYQGEDKVGCWSCDFGKVNDHFDFIAAMHGGIPFTEAKEIALEYVEESPERRRTAVVKREPKVDLNEMASRGTEQVRQDPSPLHSFLLAKGMSVKVDWLVEHFRVGLTSTDRQIIAPHMDRSLDVRGLKIRRPDGFKSVTGSSLDVLYGIWRAQGHRRVILVEGETDTWTVSWLMKDEQVDVLGIPSGVTAHPKPDWVEHLKDKEVTILFDADKSGRHAARRWRDLLGTIRYVRLREGEDATSVSEKELIRAIMEAVETGQEWPTYLQVAQSGGLMKLKGNDDPAVVADFHLMPTAVTRLEDGQGHVFDVILPNGRNVQIRSEDLATDARVRTWANGYGYTWVGTTRDAQELLRYLHHESMFKANLSGARVAGLHEHTFVLPDETLGAPGWRYVPGPMSLLDSPDMLAYDKAEWDTAIPNLLASLHRPDVITPILGWTAASFLRPLVSAFPILAVVGGAGLGKSTLMRVVLNAFGSNVATSLTATTPHAVTAFLTSTNAIPVWFDEYRLGARDDSKKVFEQSLRDAWEGSSSFKGGLKSNLQEVTRIPVSAPIAVTGEDAFEETSHIERMCLVRLPRDGRNPSALNGLHDVGVLGFARSWVSWVLALVIRGELEAPPRRNDRPEQARAVARWGYGLLQEFTQQTCGYSLPTYDESMVAAAHDQTSRRPVLVQALRALEGRRGKQGRIVWRAEDGSGALCVRVYDFVSECVTIGIPLAGGPAAVINELEQRYDVERRDDPQGEYLRVLGVE